MPEKSAITIKNLFDPILANEVRQRIMRLSPESERQWGTLTVTQTLTHCRHALHMATGVIKPRRAAFPANVIGLFIKPIVLGNDKPFRRNSPSAPELFTAATTENNFERERAQLVAAIDNFVTTAPARCTQHPHPFFGPLEPQQWAILMYKHLDHHLRQFGV